MYRSIQTTMKYINNLPRHKYPWLPILYSIILDLKPKKIIEYGTEHGGTAITMALALQELLETENHIGKIYTYDTYEMQSQGEIGSNPIYQITLDVIQRCGLQHIITAEYGDFFKFCNEPNKDFDLLYFDIDNDGDKVLTMYESCKTNIENGSIVIFEGGSNVRDNVPWMNDLQKTKINDVKNIVNYHLLTSDQKYSCSIIYNKNIYNIEL